MLGKVDRLKPIFQQDYMRLHRKNLRAGNADVKRKRSDVEQFCRDNFEGATLAKLASIYEPLYDHGGVDRLPLTKFIDVVRRPREGRL